MKSYSFSLQRDLWFEWGLGGMELGGTGLSKAQRFGDGWSGTIAERFRLSVVRIQQHRMGGMEQHQGLGMDWLESVQSVAGSARCFGIPCAVLESASWGRAARFCRARPKITGALLDRRPHNFLSTAR